MPIKNNLNYPYLLPKLPYLVQSLDTSLDLLLSLNITLRICITDKYFTIRPMFYQTAYIRKDYVIRKKLLHPYFVVVRRRICESNFQNIKFNSLIDNLQ